LNYDLKKASKNELFSAIESAGFDVRDFELVWKKDRQLSKRMDLPTVQMKRTGYFITFCLGAQGFVHRCRPGQFEFEDVGSSPVFFGVPAEAGWNAFMADAFTKWIGDLRTEVETPDLWSSLGDESKVLEAPLIQEAGEGLTTEEVEQIESACDVLLDYVRDVVSPEPERLERIEKSLGFLVSQAKKSDKKMWLHTLVSTITTITYTEIPPEFKEAFWRLAFSAINEIPNLIASIK